MNVRSALDTYLNTLENSTTRLNYEIALKEFLGKTRKLDLITREKIVKYKKSLKNKSSQTVAARLSAIRSFCDYCWSQGWMDNDPSLSIKNDPSKKYEKAKNIGFKDFKRILNQIDTTDLYGLRDYFLFRLLFITGDVDGTLSLKWNNAFPDSLNKIKIAYAEELLVFMSKEDLKGGYIFFGLEHMNADKPLSKSGARKIVKKYTIRAGFPENYVDFHALKRLRAKQIYEQTGSIEAVNQFCGHKSMKATKAFVKTF